MWFLFRWLIAVVLVFATYNPTNYNFVRWAMSEDASLPLIVLCGIILLIGYVIFLRATFRSIGAFGILLITALIGAVIWVLIDFNILSLDNPGLMTWIGLLALSVILGIGLSWSIVRRRLSGQADVDDVDE